MGIIRVILMLALGLTAAACAGAAGPVDVDYDPPALGDPDAPITIVEFGDFG